MRPGEEEDLPDRRAEGLRPHLLGPRRHVDLPSYVQGFDVGIVPYRKVPASATVVPTKIQEYLALGKPVVSTDLPAVPSKKR